jgi:polyhydroxyalkanoate synthesis regulator phasin
MAIALHRLGVPTRNEIQSLTKRVEALTRAVEKQHRPHATHHTPKPAAAV